MKKQKSKRLLSVFLAVVMVFGCVSVGVSAAYSPYLDDALVSGGNYNSIDQVTLTTEQQASLLLDKVDQALSDAGMVIDLSVLGTLDMTSVDAALDSIYDLTDNFLFGELTVGDLVVLENNRSDIATIRRSSEGYYDDDVLASVVTYLGHCAPTLAKIIDDTLDWGFVKSFLPAEVRLVLDDIPGFIKETLWDLIHPTTTDPYNGQTLDQIVQYVLDNQIGGHNAEALGFDGLLPGFELNLATDNAYRAIEEVAYSAMNEFLVPLMNSGLKGVIQDAMVANAQKGGHLEDLVNPDYVVTEFEYNRTMGFTEQINAILGHYVGEMLQPDQTLFTWRLTANAGESQADLVRTNIENLLKVIIPLGGDTVDPSNWTTQQLGQYVARSAVQEFVKHVEVPENATLRQIAVLGMKEFIASIVPDAVYTVENEDSNEAILECAKVIGVFYFNNLFDFQCPENVTFDQFLANLLDYAMQYANGIVAVDSADEDVWEKLDTIIFSIADKRWFNYEEMFRDNSGAGTEADLTVQSLVEYVLDTFLDLDFEALFTFFDHNENSSLNTMTARGVLIELVTNIVNGVVPGTIPSDITTFEDALSTTRLKAAFTTLLQGLASKQGTLLPSVLNLLTGFMGAANEQSLGKANLSIADRINCTGGSVPAGTEIRISNLTTGVNRAYRDASGTLHQDAMYKIQPISLVNDGGLTASLPADVGAINANDYLDVAVSGTVSANTEVRFDLTYNILDEDGDVLNATPLVTSTYAQFFATAGNYEATTAESSEVHQSKALAFPAYLYVTSVGDIASFSVTLQHSYNLIGGHNDSQRIMKANVSGTLPASVSANAPEDGIYTLDGLSFSVLGESAYGSINPYLVDYDPDAAQPYGIYPLQISFDLKGGSSQETVTTSAQNHTIVIYNDYGLPGLLDAIDSADRQYADYADASAEWTAYQSILKDAYALVDGNPDHAKMFDDIVVGDVTYDNAYEKMVEDVNAAVEALDAKATPTDAAAMAALKAVLEEQESSEYFDYVNYELFTFRRWQSWFNHAWSLVNSEEIVRPLDIKYAQHMVELLYPRMIPQAADKTQLNAAIAEVGNITSSAGYAPDTWADYAEAKAFAAQVSADSAAVQGKVNAARVELMKAHRNLKPEWIIPADDSLVVDSRQMFIYGLYEGVADLEEDGLATPVSGATLTYDMLGDYLGTGSYVYVTNGTEQVALYTVVLYGDLNGDGMIDTADQTIMSGLVDGTGDTAKFFAGGPFFTAADLNGDGVIDAADQAILVSGQIDQQGPTGSSS